MGNLLTRQLAFTWQDAAVDRNTAIADINTAIKSARAEGDKIFSTPGLLLMGWDSIFEFLWTDGFNYERFKGKFAWISVDNYQTLLYLHSLLGNPTPNNSTDYKTFEAEMQQGPNSLLGYADQHCSDPLVYDQISWESYHSNHAMTLRFAQRCDDFKYFKRFFKPALTKPSQQIENIINLGQVHSSILMLHDPPQVASKPVHGQQIHVHLGNPNPCALNIDGTWKHPNVKFKMTNEVKETLSEWGFLLPDECYIKQEKT